MPGLHGTATCWTRVHFKELAEERSFVLSGIQDPQATVMERMALGSPSKCSDVPAG